MPYYDHEHQQLLTPLCRKCADPYFSMRAATVPAVGCCSYSPVFSLYETYHMLKAGNRAFFCKHLYNNPNNTIRPYEIIIHAQIHPQFNPRQHASLSPIELEDLRMQYSVCQFFEENKGCSLPALFKPSVCRSFICSSIETQLNQEKQVQLRQWVKEIQGRAAHFNQAHQDILREKGWDFNINVDQVLDYLERWIMMGN